MSTATGDSVTLDAQGRILIPAEIRRELGLKPGDHLEIFVEGGEVHLLTIEQSIRRAQALVRQYIPAGRLISEELIADRRAEAARDLAEFPGTQSDD